MKKNVFGALLAVILGITFPAHAASRWDPEISWQTLVSPNFRVHYAEGQEAIAQHAARLAEELHAQLAPRLRMDPPEPTSIVLVDQADNLEEDFLSYPGGTIYLPVVPPEAALGFDHQEDWLRLAIAHEYTHSLQGKIAEGLPDALNHLIGRQVYPALLLPFSMTEGWAMLEETELTQGGRGRDAFYQAILRCAALENRPLTLAKLGGYYASDWPSRYGMAAYSYAFSHYLVERFGPETLTRINHTFSSNPLMGFEGTVKDVTGFTPQSLWEDCLVKLRQNATQVAETIPPSSIKALTEGWDSAPLVLEDGSLLFSRYDGHGASKIMLRTPGGTLEQLFSSRSLKGVKVREARFGRLSLSPDKRRLYFCALHNAHQTAHYSDLFCLDLETGKAKAITHGLRYRDAVLSPDGKRFLAVRNMPGGNSLVMLDSEGKLTHSFSATPSVQVSGIAWSPDSTAAIASVWQQGQRDLMLIDPNTGVLTPLWRDAAADITPTWSPDGRYILFASDRSGIYNLYAYQPAERALFQVTNVLGAAVSPFVSGNTLVFSNYTSKGFGISKIPYASESWSRVAIADTPIPLPTQKVATESYPSKPYWSLGTLTPRVWAPCAAQDERGLLLGVEAWGEDDLSHHQLNGQAGWGFTSQRPFYQLSYLYDRWAPTLGVRVSERVPRVLAQGSEVWQRRFLAEAALGLPLHPDIARNELGATLGVRYQENTVLPQAIPGAHSTAFLTLSRQSLYQSRFATGPEDGQSTKLLLQQRLQASPYGHFGMMHRSYYPLLPHHIFSVKLAAGWAYGGDRFGLGGSSGQSFDDNGEMPLRGYPLGCLTGTRLLGAGFDFRFPLWEIQQGIVNYPLYATRLSGDLYWEAATLFDFAQDPTARLKHSLGAELKLHGYALSLPVFASLGLGSGISPGGEFYPYLGVGTGF